jgi:hypothetical protein
VISALQARRTPVYFESADFKVYGGFSPFKVKYWQSLANFRLFSPLLSFSWRDCVAMDFNNSDTGYSAIGVRFAGVGADLGDKVSSRHSDNGAGGVFVSMFYQQEGSVVHSLSVIYDHHQPRSAADNTSSRIHSSFALLAVWVVTAAFLSAMVLVAHSAASPRQGGGTAASSSARASVLVSHTATTASVVCSFVFYQQEGSLVVHFLSNILWMQPRSAADITPRRTHSPFALLTVWATRAALSSATAPPVPHHGNNGGVGFSVLSSVAEAALYWRQDIGARVRRGASGEDC